MGRGQFCFTVQREKGRGQVGLKKSSKRNMFETLGMQSKLGPCCQRGGGGGIYMGQFPQDGENVCFTVFFFKSRRLVWLNQTILTTSVDLW